MTPIALLWNLFLYIVWKFRMTGYDWVFMRSNLTLLRYPEVVWISERIGEYLRKYFPEKIHLKDFLQEKINRDVFVEVHLKTDDPLLAGVTRGSGIQLKDPLSGILRFLTYVDSPGRAPFSPKNLPVFFLDTYLIVLMVGGDFLTTLVLVSTMWLGFYRLIGKFLIEKFLARRVEEWLVSREFEKIKVLAAALLPVFTLDGLFLLSLLRFINGEEWEIEARLVNRSGDNETFMDFFLDKVLRTFNLESRFNSEFIPEKCVELKEAVVAFLKEGDKGKLNEFFERLPEEVKNFVEDRVDFSDVAMMYAGAKLEKIVSSLLGSD